MARTFFVGIDLGTTNTVCASFEKGKCEHVKFKNKTSLSSVLLYKDNKVLVGEAAKKRAVSSADHYIKSAKTHMGDTNKTWSIDDRTFSPTDVATEILKEVVNGIRKHFKLASDVVITAVITVPAYFTSTQIDETKKAGENAGLIVKRIVTEPVAAAIAYGVEREQVGKLFVFDLGGGTFDVCIMEIELGQEKNFKTLKIDGDKRLGGDNFDTVILEYLLSYLRQEEGLDLSDFDSSGLASIEAFIQAKQRLVDVAESTKIELSNSEQALIDLPNLCEYLGKQRHLSVTLTQDTFNDETSFLLKKIKRATERCLESAQLTPNDIDKVILVGGSSHIPAVRQYVQDLFGSDKFFGDGDLGKLVANGAAILANEDSHIEESKINVQDIISHSLGIEIVGNRFAKILHRGNPYPCEKSDIFTTTYDYQEAIQISIFEGEDVNNVDNNEYYGGFTLEHIERALEGVPQVEVTFKFDENRILHVTAQDKKTNAKRAETIEVDKKKARVKPKKATTSIAVMLDTSGSMSGSEIQEAKTACIALLDMLNFKPDQTDESDYLGLVSFSSTARIVSDLSNHAPTLKQKFESMSADGYTNMHDAIRLGATLLQTAKTNRKIGILVTDGAPDSRDATMNAANTFKTQYRLITIGVGNDVDSGFLQTLATNKDRDYYFVNNIQALKNIFEEIIGALKK